MKNLKFLSLFLLISFAILFLIKEMQSFDAPPAPVATGESQTMSIQNLKIKTVTGQTISFANLNKSLYVVNYWATWCTPCQIEIPHLINLLKKYESKGLYLLGISADRTPDIVKQYLKRNQLPYPVAMRQRNLQTYFGAVTNIPTTFFFDKHFKLRHISKGYTTKETLEKIVDTILAQQ